MLRLEWSDFPRYSPAPVCGMHIHSARPKHPLPGWASPGWPFQPTPTQDMGSGETWDGFVYPGPSYCFLLYLHAYACGCVWRERAGGRMRERGRERGREREMDLHSFLDPFSSFSSMPLSPCPWVWGPPATRRCGLARGGSPSAALAPATAGTRRASEAWQPRANSPESWLDETNQAS